MLRVDVPATDDALATAGSLRPGMYAGYESAIEAAYANTQLPIRVIEGTRMRIAQINGCQICQRYRTPRDRADYFGAEQPPEEFYEAVAEWRTSQEFSPKERAAIEFAERYSSDSRSLDADEELWERLHQQFSDPELVDLGLFVGASLMGGRFIHVFGLDAVCSLSPS
jgi:alkylhydroperoxidase family enzyme